EPLPAISGETTNPINAATKIMRVFMSDLVRVSGVETKIISHSITWPASVVLHASGLLREAKAARSHPERQNERTLNAQVINVGSSSARPDSDSGLRAAHRGQNQLPSRRTNNESSRTTYRRTSTRRDLVLT